MNPPILSIVIPTYNRAPLLKLLLNSIVRDLPDWPEDVELVVSDNASTDGTRGVVAEVAARGTPIRLVSNAENVGMDRNLAACFGLASGRYFWQIGDDDILFEGALTRVLAICRGPDFGILHLASEGFHEGDQARIFAIRAPAAPTVLKLDRTSLFRSINVFLTFISANVVNRAAVLKRFPGFDHTADLNTYLPQLAWIYAAVEASDKHLHIPAPLFGALTGNTGGYRLVEVFGVNLARITGRRLGAAIPRAESIMLNAALTRVIGNEIGALRKGGRQLNRFADEDTVAAMCRCFGKRFYFRALVGPMAFSSSRLGAAGLFLLLRFFNRVNRRLGYRLL